MNNRCADPTFGLHPQALAVLALLVGRDPDFADWDEKLRRYVVEINTFPWYNGRERGVCLMMRRTVADSTCLHVAFGECRNSDRIFVEQWVGKVPFNAPTLEGRTAELGEDECERLYRRRATFWPGAIGEVANHIIEVMRAFYEESK